MICGDAAVDGHARLNEQMGGTGGVQGRIPWARSQRVRRPEEERSSHLLQVVLVGHDCRKPAGLGLGCGGRRRCGSNGIGGLERDPVMSCTRVGSFVGLLLVSFHQSL